MTTYRLWSLLRGRKAEGADPVRLAGWLAAIGFAAVTAAALIVLGGILAFVRRARSGLKVGSYDASTYVLLAAIAGILLIVPVVTLGAASARLSAARRDQRLATLRLVGATTGQVSGLTVLESSSQALIGALAGVAGYFVLVPAVARLSFQGRAFAWSELWTGVPAIALTVVAVVAVATASALAGLRQVIVTPLGVTARVSPPRLRAVRVLTLPAAVVALILVKSLLPGVRGVSVALMVTVIFSVMAAGMATLNLIGPFLVSILARMVAARTRKVTTLLAARRLVDDPRSAWRSVGGVAIAAFIAGVTAAAAGIARAGASDPGEEIFLHDLGTGGLLTLAIASILAGVSTGVMQAGRVIDQRRSYHELVLVGARPRQLDAARLRETGIPLTAALGSAVVASVLLTAPLLSAGVFTQPIVLVRFALGVLMAAALVLLGAASSTVVARRMSALPTPAKDSC